MNIKVGARVLVESKAEDLSFWQDLEQNLSKMVSLTGNFTFNKPAGVVTVTVNALLRALHARTTARTTDRLPSQRCL